MLDGHPLRVYRWADAPQPWREAARPVGGEQFLLVVPPEWLDESRLLWIPHVLWLLLAAPTDTWWPQIERAWGAVHRVTLEDGTLLVVVGRT